MLFREDAAVRHYCSMMSSFVDLAEAADQT
jgi:hypothetical protein